MARQPPVSKAVQEDMAALFGQTDPETGKPYTIEKVAAQVNLPISTVGRYRQRWEERSQAEQEMASAAIRPDPVVVLQETLRDIPGLGERNTDFVIKQVRRNPALMQNPNDLYRLLTEGCRLSNYYANLAIQAVMAVQQQPAGPSFFPPSGPMPSAPPGFYPQQGGGYAPGYPASSYPQPYPVPWPQPQAPPAVGVTKEEVAQIVAQALAQHQPQAPAPSGEYEEVQEPVLDAQGQPVMGPDGPLLRFRRMPIGARREAPVDPLLFLERAKGILRPETPSAPAAPSAELQELREAVRALKDKEGSTTQQALADLKAEFAAERVRREEAEKHLATVRTMEEKLRSAEVRAANTGLPPDAQILKGGIDTVDRHAQTVLNNMDKRMGRLEGLVTKVLLPSPPGVSLPVGPEVVAQLEARQAAVDRAERRDAPAAPTSDAPEDHPVEAATETAKAPTDPPDPEATA